MSIDPDEVIPDVPQTALAFRTWRLSDDGRLLSINAPNLTGKAGAGQQRRVSWVHRALADPEGQHGWPIGVPLKAHCGVQGDGAEQNEDHGQIPSKNCSCGIYATTSIKVINQYLGNEISNGAYIRGPVLGVVEMGGSVIPATQGYRAAYARVAAILQIDEAFSLPAGRLKRIADFYQVPLFVPPSTDPEDCRRYIEDGPPIDPSVDIAEEAALFLQQQEKGDKEDE